MVEQKDEYKYFIEYTSAVKRDLKRAKKRNLKLDEFEKVVKMIAKGEPLPENYNDHELVGNWKNHRECHIRPDWLLIYQIKDDILVLELTRTGSHSDLF
ncbi:MAG: type II toxin-antitoxin system YafQ family toxin [Treponema sp.]|nr:type II toxin-antitoxin system YafQ family toxin [Treponema sp.]